MARRRGGGAVCEQLPRIDVRAWHREGRIQPGQSFSFSWRMGEEPYGSIHVETEPGAIVLRFRTRETEDAAWRGVEQRVPLVWTACHLGGGRPWFRCEATSNAQYCGRRVAVLYLGGAPVFACRKCYGLAYATQRESLG